MIRHIVWDWNGTIIDDIDVTVEVVQQEFLRHGLVPLTKERYRKIFRHPVRLLYESAGLELDDATFKEICNRFEQNYASRWRSCSPFPDIVQTLAAISELGLTQSILSALPHQMLCQSVEYFHLNSFFPEVVGLSNNHGASKVASAVQWMKESSFSPDELMIVGDTDHDAEVAHELGIKCVLISRGYQDSEILNSTGRPVFSSAAPVVDFILNHRNN
jgi:phosphoglycolate phosphatase